MQGVKIEADAREEYEAWVRDMFPRLQRGDPRSLPPSFENWKLGYRTPVYKIPGRLNGMEVREHDYTFERWKFLMLPWQEEGEVAFSQIRSGAIRNMWIWSPDAGTAKTGYAISVAKDLAVSRSMDGEIIRMSRIATLNHDQRKVVIETLQKRDLVVIDDVHRFRFSQDYLADWFHSLLDVCYNRRILTLVTAQAAYASVCKLAGKDFEAAFDRLREGGLVEIAASGGSVRG